MAKVKLSDVRAKFPMYEDMSDEALLGALHRKYYSDIPVAQFAGQIDYDTQREKYKPTAGDGENFVAAIGKGLADTVRGVGQVIRMADPFRPPGYYNGMPGDQASIDEAKRLDAPLMDTKAGIAGSIVGQLAPAVLAAPVSGAGAIGGALAGATMGGVQPVASDESRATNVAIGGVAGAAGPVLARGVSAGYGAVKGLVEPFTESGRTAITGRTLQRFGVNAADVEGLTGAPTVTGARPTLAEQIQRPEGAAAAARLQDAVRSLDPEIAARITARETVNNAARVGTLRQLAGQDGGRDFAVAERAATTQPMYEDAFRVAADGLALTPEQSRAMTQLMRSPDVMAAARQAQRNASNRGANVGPANSSGSVEGLHQVKLALDDKIAQAEGGSSAAAHNMIEGLRSARDRLVGFIESVSPEYANARGVYAQMSRPVNQMDVAGDLLRRGTSATTDLSGTPRLMPNALMSYMRDEGGLMQRATGRNLGNDLAQLMEPNQLTTLRAVTSEVDRNAAVGRAANGPGSATAQRLASTNLLHQIGLPQNMTDNALIQTLMRPIQFGAAVAEPRIQQNLLAIMLDPSQAAAAMRAATPAQRVELNRLISNPELAQAIRATVPAGALGTRQRGE